MIDTVLFDFDGTLVDSEPNYAVSDCRMVARFGGDLSIEEHDAYVGYGSKRFLKAMKERYHIDATLQEMRAVQDECYLALAREDTPVFPVMKELLENLRNRGITMAVASGTPQSLLEELLYQTGLNPYFKLILSSETTGKAKPEPQVFLKAAEILGKKKENCLVLEDSLSGAQAGVRAGMETLVLVSPYLKNRIHEFPKEARLIAGGMEEFHKDHVLSRVCGPNS
ncbi:MAG: HAD family phosphatase [Spirochaetales bacterium]|nr:HAD family phosphatase [Spirochaetales bacterium]